MKSVPEFKQDFFELFGLPVRYALDLDQLERAFRSAQAAVHPDRFAHAPDAEKRASMQWSTHVNEAYQTLRSPNRRAAYLLRKHGVDPGFETNTTMCPEFLTQQMEWREAIEEAVESADARGLDRLSRRANEERQVLQGELVRHIDGSGDFVAAAETLRKLMFLQKLENEIGDAIERIET